VPDVFYYDLFISYSRDDNRARHISELVSLIQKEYRDFTGGEELRVFFDQGEFAGIDDWQHNILEGIRSSRLLLACLSPNYLDCEYGPWEFNEYLRRGTAGTPLARDIWPIYFVEIPARSDRGFEQRAADWVAEFQRRYRFDFRPWFDEGAVYLREEAVKVLVSNTGTKTPPAPGRIHRVIHPKGNLDWQNEHFVDRIAEMRRLREIVAFGKLGVLAAINGPDGIGKTALAIQYSQAFAHEYPGGCWEVPCAGREDLRVALAGLTGVRDFEFGFTEEEKRDLDLGFERVLGELKQRAESAKPSRVFLLLDNVDRLRLLESDQVLRLARADWLHIVVTTPLDVHEVFNRRKDLAFLTLNRLPEEEALALIERYQPSETFLDDATRDAAQDVVRLIGGFALAVERAGVFIGEFARGLNCASFRDQLRSKTVTDHKETARETIGGLYDAEQYLSAILRSTLEGLGEAERTTLIFTSLLPADHVALPWVRVLAARELPELGKDAPAGFCDPWQDLLQRLFRLRLLLAGAGPYEARMHPLIQEMVKLNAGPEILGARERALLAYVKARAEFLWEGWVRPEHRWELVPLTAAAWHWMQRDAKEGAYLANQAFGPLRSLGNFVEAEPLMRYALAVDERSCGLNHPNVATCLNNLAALLHETNRPKEAESLYRRALVIDEQSFGRDDPRVATCLNNLAQLLQATNRLEEAEPLYRRALSIDERGFGPSHPKVATHLNNLAQLLRVTNRLEEAEPLYRRALAIDEEGLGPNHPRVATHLSNLAQLLQATNRPEEAKPLYRRALSIDEESFGPNHPRVATHLNNLALLLNATDQPAEAEPLYRRALSIDGQNFGWDHPNVGTDLNNLATLLETTNRLEEAESLMRLMLGIFLRSSASQGREHAFLQAAIRNYTALLADMGWSPIQIIARLEELARPLGISFGSKTRSDIAQQCDQRQALAMQPGRRALKSLFGKAAAFLKGIASRGK
jgi:tetratricopeptide (TPR) repeat protein